MVEEATPYLPEFCLPTFGCAGLRRHLAPIAVVLTTICTCLVASVISFSLPSRALAFDRSVGFSKIRVPNGQEPDLIGGVWYPTRSPAHDQPLEDFVQRVAPNAPVSGRSLPLVVISHGGGGSFASHYDTALALAHAGFVVAAINHAGDTHDDESRVLELWRRPAQLSCLISYMTGGWGARKRLDETRIGAFGFSNGGFTVLVAAGGVPDLRHGDAYCATNTDHDLCIALKAAGVRSLATMPIPVRAWVRDARIRSIVSAAPAFGFTFDRLGLASMQVPVQLWSAQEDRHQPDPWYEAAVRDALARPLEYRVVRRAGHFAFLPPCGERLTTASPLICKDAEDFDRVGFHRHFNTQVVQFFRSQ